MLNLILDQIVMGVWNFTEDSGQNSIIKGLLLGKQNCRSRMESYLLASYCRLIKFSEQLFD